MSKKIASDTAAYVRSLAEARGRNVKLATDAVLESRAFTDREALQASPPLVDLAARGFAAHITISARGWAHASRYRLFHVALFRALRERLAQNLYRLLYLFDANVIAVEDGTERAELAFAENRELQTLTSSARRPRVRSRRQ